MREDFYDAIIIANGRYERPFIPIVKGLAEWKAQHSNAIVHSKFYRNAGDFVNKVRYPST